MHLRRRYSNKDNQTSEPSGNHVPHPFHSSFTRSLIGRLPSFTHLILSVFLLFPRITLQLICALLSISLRRLFQVPLSRLTAHQLPSDSNALYYFHSSSTRSVVASLRSFTNLSLSVLLLFPRITLQLIYALS